MVVRDLLEFDIILLWDLIFLLGFLGVEEKDLYWYGRKCFSLLKKEKLLNISVVP